MVSREGYTEGSETAKPGTDEQEVHKRHTVMGKQAHLCNARPLPKMAVCRCTRHRVKDNALTWGGLGIDSVSMRQEVSRGHSSCSNEPPKDRWKSHKPTKD
ncbi:MAG: hypothetical protein FVQ77_10565 [Cytophagales bacterium]|nr:hypothetical protein [Cytophagales bacterium]